jgi:hypothetical protein
MKTLTGRELKGFEKIADLKTGSYKKVSNFIIKEAIKEAELKGDSFMVMRFKSENLNKIPQATLDEANIYLFGKTNYFDL